MYIKSLTLKKEFRNIKPFTIEFKDGINVIVGENGSGKSTLLNLLDPSENTIYSTNLDAEFDVEITDLCKEVGCDTRYFDSEKMNPRTVKDANYALDVKYTLISHFMSHGQSLFPLVEEVKKFKNTFVMLDEPENGISISNQLKLIEAFKKSVENKNQLVISTHSYFIIKSVDEVFDLETMSWIDSKEYLKKFNI